MSGCAGCKNGKGFQQDITMAFQPIVNMPTGEVFAYEALVRGKHGESAGQVLENVTSENLYAFDQKCRVTAIELANRLALQETGAFLSINFLPSAVYEPRACIRATLEAALRTGFPANKILFEFTEVEKLDAAHVLNILRTYKALGFKTAIDDFGAGYAGLGLLSEFVPDFVKIDMHLIRGIDTSTQKQIIVRNTLAMLEDLGITPVCEGIETQEEYSTLQGLGVALMQGYLFAKPEIETLPEIILPNVTENHRAAL
jgi:EAL domain-containing protein (putative c-di-GMP-specific phosphodiesterase class I)